MPIAGLPKLQRTGDLKAAFGTVLAYGPAGAGKTRSIITMKEFNPLIIGTELGETGGFLSVVQANLAFVTVSTHAETIDVIRACKRKPGKVEYEGQEFGAVILDSITAWGEFPLERYMELKGWKDLHGVTVKGEGKDPRTAYGFLAEKGRQLYKELFGLHAHLYIIAREGLFGGGDDGPIFAAPELPGQKLPRELPGWPDATVRLRIVNGKHRMVTKGQGGTPARVRLAENVEPLPDYCLPNISALIKLMMGDKAARNLLVPSKEEKTAEKPAEE